MAEQKALQHLLRKGKISRRDFLTRLSALGVTAAVAPAFFTSIAQAQKIRKGGRLRLGLGGGSTTDSLDPSTINDAMTMSINWQIRNCLVEVNQKGDLVPELVKNWESTPDAKKWIFKLRHNVEFHNGKTLEADDVVFSINHHRGQNSKSAAKSIVHPIDEISVENKYTVVFSLRESNAEFPFILSDPHLPIVPAGTAHDDWEKGIGTGGYVLQDWEPGYRAFAKRNPNYWKEDRAHFDEVETIGIADAASRLAALNTKQIDAMNRFQLNLKHLLPRARDIQIINITGTKHFSMPMLTDRAPFNNNDVRLALKYAIDREQLLKEVVRGYGAVANDHPIAPCQRSYSSELAQRTYDPERAKFHMKKAGMLAKPFRLHVADAGWPGADATAAAMLYKEQAAKAGIKIDVIIEPDDGYWEKYG